MAKAEAKADAKRRSKRTGGRTGGQVGWRIGVCDASCGERGFRKKIRHLDMGS